jgi:tetratricopeptide (TPR) repeat protein
MENRKNFPKFAGMKRFGWIGLLVLLALVACAPTNNDDAVGTRHGTSLPTTIASPELSAIDSLMWRQPDSALACLIPYFDTCCRDAKFFVSTTTSFNRHYANLLLAELLYKNDYAQTNRPALLEAVVYFDSLTFTLNDIPSPKRLIAGTDPLSLTRNDNLVFLDARAHYINGVGYYENESMVEACKEYLKALEVMESHFQEKDLVGKKAKFMTYTYNRLGEMFEKQYMMDPALDCYRHSYDYSIISPISSYSISNALYHIGKQYDKKGDKDSADYYYIQALVNIPDSTNLYYRDMVSTQALLSYQLTHQAEMSLERLKQMAVLAADDDERLTRYTVIGNIFFEEGMYDSALLYLEPVLENKRNRFLQIRVANYLRIIYDSLGNREKSNECMSYLALHNETGAENSAMVSQLSEIYKTYKSQKQEKEAVAKREVAVKKALGIVVPMAVILALAIIVTAKLRSKKLLQEQREESERVLGETTQQHKEELKQRQVEAEKTLEDKEKYHQQEMEAKEAQARKELEERDKQHTEAIEAERQAHRMEQAAISGRLKQKNEEVRELKDQIKRQDELDATPKQAETFTDEPICRLILERVKEGQFLSQIDCKIYKDNALSKEQVISLREAADHHFGLFTIRLIKAYPKLTNSDLDYCCLYLLGLSDADISALMQKAYPTVSQRSRKIKAILGNNSPLPITLRGIANNDL